MRPAFGLVLVLALTASPMRAGAAGDRDHRVARLREILAAHPDDPRVLLKLGEQLVYRADEVRRPEAISEARHTLNLALQAGAGPEARAWLGLLLCLEAKHGSGPMARALAQAGLRDLDEAVETAPANLKFRVMRATVGLQVPREWKRLDQAKDDLLIAELAVRRDPARLKRFDLDAAELYFKLGQAHLGAGELAEAREAWQHAQKVVPVGKWTREAERLLRRHGS